MSGWGLAHLASGPALDCVTRLLTPNPRERLSVEAALAHPWFEEERQRERQRERQQAALERSVATLEEGHGGGSQAE